MVLLFYLGIEGTGSSNERVRQVFGIGSGTAQKFRDRAVEAIRSLCEQAITWPDESERCQISSRIFKKYGFPNCIGIADGTLFPLALKPEKPDAPDYLGRKFGYSISTLVVCEDKQRIRYYLSGWPGSAHDNRIFDMSMLGRSPKDFFDDKQYIVGDSAYTPSVTIIPAFKKMPNKEMPREEELFNRKLARLHIISEHTIGILKARFPWLRNIRQKITVDDCSSQRVLEYIDVCVILHNLLIRIEPEEEAIPNDIIDHNDFDEMIDEGEIFAADDDVDDDYANGIERQQLLQANDELNQKVPDNALNTHRRKQLLGYFCEVDYRFV